VKRDETSEALKIVKIIQDFHKNGYCLDSDSDLFQYVLKLPMKLSLDLSGRICVKSLIPLALEALSLGVPPEEVSSYLSWRDFEELVNSYLQLNGFETIRSFRFTERRYEIDVVGFNLITKYSLFIDCKHWSPGYNKKGKLKEVAEKHRKKVNLLAQECNLLVNKVPSLSKVRWLVPVVVTLTESLKGYIKGSFVVPISSLNNFIAKLVYYIDVLSDFNGRVKNLCYTDK